MVFQSIKNTINSITTKHVFDFYNRWLAIISILLVYIILIFAIKNLLNNTSAIQHTLSKPTITHPDITHINQLNDFWYFDGVGIHGASTNFGEQSIPTETADKCKLFGNKCLGFDTIGNLLLERDKGIANLRAFHPTHKGGFYLKAKQPRAHTFCNQLKGRFNTSKQTCNNFKRDEITNLNFTT